MVIEVTDEAGDSAFEVDVVFPQRIVRVDEQGLRGGWIQAGHLSHIIARQPESTSDRERMQWKARSSGSSQGGFIRK